MEEIEKLEQAVKEAQKEEPKWPSQQDIIDMKASEMIEEEKAELRIKAENWAEEKANSKAMIIAEQERALSIQEKQFNTLRNEVKYYADWWALPSKMTEAQAMMTIQMWKQMNMNMFEALQGIWYVNWKMIIYWEVMVSQLTKAGYRVKLNTSNAEKCNLTITWKNWKITEEFTIEQAKKAGWVKGFWPWQSQPHMMLRYKAIRQWIKFLAPEVMSGLSTYEEVTTEIEPETEPIQEADIQTNITNKFKKND